MIKLAEIYVDGTKIKANSTRYKAESCEGCPALALCRSEDDLQLFWKALENMFDTDRSAARGQMAARKLVIFKHRDSLGNAPAHRLLERE